MFLKFLVTTFLFAIAAGGLHAQLQGKARVDSLLKEMPKTKEDTNKAGMLYELAREYTQIDPEQGAKYTEQCLALSTKLGWKSGMASANHVRGLGFRNKGDYRKELEYYTIAYKIDSEIDNKRGMARDLLGIGNSYGSLCIFPEALRHYDAAVKLNEETGNKRSMAGTYVSIGNVYIVQGDYPHALDYYFKSLAISEEIGDKGGSARTNFSIGNVYSALRDFPVALDYYFKALGFYEGLGNKYGTAIAAQGIGIVYNMQKQYARALEYETKALKIANEIGNKYVAIACVGNIGSIYRQLKNYPMALAYSKRASEMAEESGDRHQVAWGLMEIGYAYVNVSDNFPVKDTLPEINVESIYPPDNSMPAGDQEKLKIGIAYLRRALDTAKKYDAPEIMKPCYQALAWAYQARGDYKISGEYYQMYVKINDSIFTHESIDQVTKIGMSYRYNKERAIDSVATADAKHAAALKLERQRRYTWIGLGGALLLASLLTVMVRNNKLLSKEKQKSEELLLNILPSEVAEELKTTGSTAAKHFDNVTVMFTDFVNFTSAGEKMGAQELIDELHTCFKAFDEITAKYNIEKIKTIGDAYLAAAGLPVKDTLHAEHIVRAALEIRDFMDMRYAENSNKTFKVRIGIHSGSVVAGIVGVKKFAYDIWGDTVNTAARMEQNSEPGRVNISQTTYDLVKGKFNCEYRGEIDAKNKGKLAMYFVNT
ncbi:MAG: hypothetical protein K0Q79_905 [Flavipsychrobacter sp.]|nr:hypothetical protein [Flavipsychrobacter sp.]